MILTLLVFAPDAYAQRYLSEFVGATKVVGTAGAVSIDTNLSFDTLERRALDGAFSFTEVDTLGNVETELFSVVATLAASGQCPARLSNDSTSGKLQLDEYNFDTNAFALYGSFELSADGGDVSLATGRLRGPTVMLNPPEESLLLAYDAGKLSLSGGKETESFSLVLDAESEFGAYRGEALDARGDSGWTVVLSASSKWLYLVGSSATTVLVGRAAVETDERGNTTGGTGTWEELTEEGKVLDSGSFTVALGE